MSSTNDSSSADLPVLVEALELYGLEADSRQPVLLSVDYHPASFTWSPAGDRLATITGPQRTLLALYAAPFEDARQPLWTLDAGNTIEAVLWSPDGSWIALSQRDESGTSLAILRATAGEPIEVASSTGSTAFSGASRLVGWRPAGRLVVLGDARSRGAVRELDAAERRWREITEIPLSSQPGVIHLSPDGGRLAVVVPTSTRSERCTARLCMINARWTALRRRSSHRSGKTDQLDAHAIALFVRQEGADLPRVLLEDQTTVLELLAVQRDQVLWHQPPNSGPTCRHPRAWQSLRIRRPTRGLCGCCTPRSLVSRQGQASP